MSVDNKTFIITKFSYLMIFFLYNLNNNEYRY